MPIREIIMLAGLLATGSALAQPMDAEAARRFVIGKQFAYNCFDGTRGTGYINGDGSVVGTVQTRGQGPVRYAMLPAGTLRVKGKTVCAALRGMPFEPCFNLSKTDSQSFRGSVSGLGFAYCDFTRRTVRPSVAAARAHPVLPLAVSATPASAQATASPAETAPAE